MSYQEKEKALRIMEALSEVDEDLLARCEDSGVVKVGTGTRTETDTETGTSKKVIPFWRYGKVMAACAAGLFIMVGFLAVSGGVLWNGVMSKNETAAGIGLNSADCAMQEAAVEEATTEEATPEAAEDKDFADNINNSISNSIQEAGGEQFKENDGEDAQKSEITDGMSGAEVEMAEPEDLIGSANITLEEARSLSIMGAYIPQVIPDGYKVESVRQNADEVVLLWSKGMDTIRILVTGEHAFEQGVKPEEQAGIRERLIDTSKPETYNVHLYDIPYAETVPSEYWQCFDHPIFREEDMTREIVEARMKVVEDAGDTATPRGNFAVLYENGILVEFSVDASVEEVWEMYSSIQP